MENKIKRPKLVRAFIVGSNPRRYFHRVSGGKMEVTCDRHAAMLIPDVATTRKNVAAAMQVIVNTAVDFEPFEETDAAILARFQAQYGR